MHNCEALWIRGRGGAKVMLLLAVIAGALSGDHALASAVICEKGKGYVAIDASEQLSEDFLRQIKALQIDNVIRYYDWSNETLPGKTLTTRELRLIAKLDMNVAVVFQHHNDCLCTFT